MRHKKCKISYGVKNRHQIKDLMPVHSIFAYNLRNNRFVAQDTLFKKRTS